ncbi:hypothetical protein GCM10010271_57670 [Streptomyces kurssanovii]|nr:hypothetical protein GCM10010271_57670 [Streptomyces kurssanovii]
MAVSLVRFLLPRPGIRYRSTQAAYRVWVFSPVAVGRMKESPGCGGGEGLETPGAGCGRLDVPGDVAWQFVLADGVFQGGLEYGVDVHHGQR